MLKNKTNNSLLIYEDPVNISISQRNLFAPSIIFCLFTSNIPMFLCYIHVSEYADLFFKFLCLESLVEIPSPVKTVFPIKTTGTSSDVLKHLTLNTFHY